MWGEMEGIDHVIVISRNKRNNFKKEKRLSSIGTYSEVRWRKVRIRDKHDQIHYLHVQRCERLKRFRKKCSKIHCDNYILISDYM